MSHRGVSVPAELRSQTQCYPCPSCYACDSSTDNSNPFPARGYWRRGSDDRALLQCVEVRYQHPDNYHRTFRMAINVGGCCVLLQGLAAASPCMGGPNEALSEGGATPCKAGHIGLLCGSCVSR